MKLLTLLLSSLVCTVSCLGQDRSVQVAIGGSFPVDQFKRNAAKTGITGAISFQHQLKYRKYLGINVLVRVQSYQVDNNKLSGAFNDALYATYNVSGKSWTATSVMVGPMWSFKLNHNIYFEPRVLIGYTRTLSPDIEGNAGFGGRVSMVSLPANSVSTLVGANFRFDAGKRVSLFVNIDSFYAKPTLEWATTRTNPSSFSFFNNSTQLFTVNTTFGVGYRYH
jgi:hypothetical protein